MQVRTGRSSTRVPLLRHSNRYKYQSISRHPLANRDPTPSPQIERASFLYHGNLDLHDSLRNYHVVRIPPHPLSPPIPWVNVVYQGLLTALGALSALACGSLIIVLRHEIGALHGNFG